ncbi:MAG: NUDIX hydrolase [Lentilactobacillus diolivorans]|jgi:ADP-ribose pyrophosphatase YjhB (NUDIX family)|nr:NUDIX hydrolase [Lentilactobacillus diolivorans]RRG01950.1 MAG: NUDIX domain-containing protein [Lactobacillus sp.]
MSKKFHRAFGVYGIISHHDRVVVIKKNGGPYINRYDLPGGSLEDGEPLQNAIVREIKEETGLVPTQLDQLGVTSFRFPWQYKRWNYNQHICVFYEITNLNGKLTSQVTQFIGQDSLGALEIPLAELNINNVSPLVLKAKDFLEHGKVFDSDDWSYDEWDVLDQSVFEKKS